MQLVPRIVKLWPSVFFLVSFCDHRNGFKRNHILFDQVYFEMMINVIKWSWYFKFIWNWEVSLSNIERNVDNVSQVLCIFIQKHGDPPDIGGRRHAKGSEKAIPFVFPKVPCDILRGGGRNGKNMWGCGSPPGEKNEICGERGSARLFRFFWRGDFSFFFFNFHIKPVSYNGSGH